MKTMAMVFIYSIIFMGSVFMGMLLVDALEYEATGECEHCMVLDKIRPGLAGGVE